MVIECSRNTPQEWDGRFEHLFETEFAIAHHVAAPLFPQRSAYLQHLATQGRRRKTLQGTASLLIHVIRVLRIQDLRQVTDSEMRDAARRWSEEVLKHRTSSSKKSASAFYTVANGFLKYLGLKKPSESFDCCFDLIFFRYRDFLLANGYRTATIKALSHPVRSFLLWASRRYTDLQSVCIKDINDYLEEGVAASAWRPRTVVGQCQAIRTFFRFAESREGTTTRLSEAITAPVVRARDCQVSGPAWEDVRRMIRMTGTASEAESRAKTILLLCAVYGLRTAEIIRLTIDAFDWLAESFVVQRAKNGRWQRFPVTQELGEAIFAYLRFRRSASSCRTLFLTLSPPYRPLQNLTPIVRKQMRAAKIDSTSFGPHSLRHSCATELLRQGTSLQKIADLLGHRDLRSVSIYARHDWQSLLSVANFSLSGLL